MSVRFDENAARELEKSYLTPPIQQQRARTLARLPLTEGAKVLDVGCGVGLLSESLSERVGDTGQVVACDRSSSMVAATRARCLERANVSVHEASVGELPFESGSCDGAAIAQVLLYVDDPLQALGDVHRVLVPGGVVVVIETDWRGVVLGTGYPELCARAFSAWDAKVPSPNLPGRLPALLRESGFERVSVEAIPVLETDWQSAGFSVPMVRDIIQLARKRGTLSADEAALLWDEQQARGEAGDYFFCVNRFLFEGRRAA